jgi:hypothetical protein
MQVLPEVLSREEPKFGILILEQISCLFVALKLELITMMIKSV